MSARLCTVLFSLGVIVGQTVKLVFTGSGKKNRRIFFKIVPALYNIALFRKLRGLTMKQSIISIILAQLGRIRTFLSNRLRTCLLLLKPTIHTLQL